MHWKTIHLYCFLGIFCLCSIPFFLLFALLFFLMFNGCLTGVQVLAEKTGVEQWVCGNIVHLLKEENTIPFIVRYRKELINHMDADAVRDVQLAVEDLW